MSAMSDRHVNYIVCNNVLPSRHFVTSSYCLAASAVLMMSFVKGVLVLLFMWSVCVNVSVSDCVCVRMHACFIIYNMWGPKALKDSNTCFLEEKGHFHVQPGLCRQIWSIVCQ